MLIAECSSARRRLDQQIFCTYREILSFVAIRSSLLDRYSIYAERVLGSEMGAGSIDASGTVHLISTWEIRGITVHGDYTGNVSPNGGTLTGTQSWRGPDGEAHSRTCHAALVSAADTNQPSMKQ
jgi:hypothetical protein